MVLKNVVVLEAHSSNMEVYQVKLLKKCSDIVSTDVKNVV